MRNIVSAGIAMFVLGTAGFSNRYASATGQTVPPAQSHDVSESTREEQFLRVLPDVSAMVGAAGVSGGDYNFRTERQVAIDLLTLENFFFHFDITETDLFDPSPSQIDHSFQYLGIGRKTRRGNRITLFWDHTCYNPTRELPPDEYNGIHWHEVGLGYETNDMRPGHENDGLEFDSEAEWLNAINWKASASKTFAITENEYRYMLKLHMRDDIFRYGGHVAFAQLELNSISDDRGTRVDPRLEIGDRIRLNRNMSLIPFLSYERYHDWYALGEGEDFFLAGVRIEGNLGGDRRTHTGSRAESGTGETEREGGEENNLDRESQQNNDFSWTPGLHVDGGYAGLLDGNDYGFSSDVGIDLDLLELHSNMLSLNTYAGVLTLPGDLVPYVTEYKIGASVNMDWGDYLARSDSRIFYSYSCLYGVDDENRIKYYDLIGLELSNETSNPSWGAQVGVYPSTSGYDYWADLLASVSYDFRRKGITPYVGCAGRFLPGDESELGYAVEGGLRIPGEKGTFSIYLRRQDDFNIFKFGKGEQMLLGFTLRFL